MRLHSTCALLSISKLFSNHLAVYCIAWPASCSDNYLSKLCVQDSSDPLAHVHFKGEGDVEFRSILFVPSHLPDGMLDNYYNQQTGLDLYVRRVFITNSFDELIPK